MIRVPEPPIPAEERYIFRVGRPGLLMGLGALAWVGLIALLGVSLATTDEITDPVERLMPLSMLVLFLVAALAIAVYVLAGVVNARVTLTDDAIVVRNWRGRERRVAWDQVWAMRMRFGGGMWLGGWKGTASGVRLELLPRDEDEGPIAEIRTLGLVRVHDPPDVYTRLTAAIAGRRKMFLADDQTRLNLIWFGRGARGSERIRYWRR
jgi:hypothetical protein